MLADNLAQVRPDLGGNVVICPLCYREFGPDAVDAKEITEEHIIPQAVGGRLLTLTCKRCNSNWGAAFDSHFVQSIRAADALAFGALPIRGRADVAGAVVNAEYVLRSGERHDPQIIRVLPSKPDAIKAVTERFQSRTVEELHASLHLGFIRDRADRALIRIALLGLFRTFGYAYALAEGVREYWTMIKNFDGDTVNAAPMFISRKPPMEGRIKDPFLVVAIQAENRAVGYVAVIRVATEKERYFSVLMPTENSAPNTVITDLRSLSDALAGRPITIKLC